MCIYIYCIAMGYMLPSTQYKYANKITDQAKSNLNKSRVGITLLASYLQLMKIERENATCKFSVATTCHSWPRLVDYCSISMITQSRKLNKKHKLFSMQNQNYPPPSTLDVFVDNCYTLKNKNNPDPLACMTITDLIFMINIFILNQMANATH